VSEANREAELEAMLAKAQRMLDAAQAALRDAFLETATSRGYYAAFHAIQALLKSIDQAYSSHAGVAGAFHREFVKKGIFPPDLGKSLTRLARHREAADYSYRPRMDMDEVREDVQRAARILKSIRGYLELDGGNAQPTET